MQRQSMEIKQAEVKRILIINLGGIGDLLLSVPALRALRRLYQEAQICFLVVPRAVELVKEFDFIDEVISFSFYNERSKFRSEEHTSELQSHSFISYAVFCLKKKKKKNSTVE